MGWSLVLYPKATRVVAGIFTIETIADFLHIAYDTAKKLEKE